MPLFGHSKVMPFGPNGALVGEFLDIASSLTSDEASRVDQVARESGFAGSRDLELAIAILVNAGMALKLNRERGAAQRAGHDAIERCEAARGKALLGYAAGLMAEAFVVRGAVDPMTWSYVSQPWLTIFEIPPLCEGEEPVAVARARAARALVESC